MILAVTLLLNKDKLNASNQPLFCVLSQSVVYERHLDETLQHLNWKCKISRNNLILFTLTHINIVQT